MNIPIGEPETGIPISEQLAAGSPPLHPVGFDQRLLNRARALGFARGDRLVIGFSGGRDSLALAGAMRWVERRLGVVPTLVHIDHGLRSNSAEDARAGASLAESLGIAFESHRLKAAPRHVHSGVGLEEAARRERYRQLQGAAMRLGASTVATAHHQQDQAETVLLHLLRGGGVAGARAMAEVSDIPVDGLHRYDISQEPINAILWRPLLQESPVEIDRYVKHLGLTPIADDSNDDLALRRNAVRHRVLPLLEDVAPGAAEALARYAALAAEDDVLLGEICNRATSDAMRDNGALDARSLIDQPMAMQRRMIRRWLEKTTAEPPVTMDRTDKIIALACRNVGGKSVEIGGGWTVQLVRGMLQTRKWTQLEAKRGSNDDDN